MPTDASGFSAAAPRRLLSPLVDAVNTDDAVVTALVTAEVALARAWGEVGVAPASAVSEIERALGWTGAGQWCVGHEISAEDVATKVATGGNPVIPLIPLLRARVSAEAGEWIHRSATSQDIMDTGLMMLAVDTVRHAAVALEDTERALSAFALEHRDTVAVARTLTQHAVPTTVGLRARNWLAGIKRARVRLVDAAAAVPAQLGGAAGTLAASVEVARTCGVKDPVTVASALPAAFAAEVGLAAPETPWHTTRWPVTELGDALVQAVDALGVLASDVALLTRPELSELTVGATGGSSAMPHKRNPTAAVLIRSAAMRAPHLAATLHTASACAVDERPDGAWHAEWPVLDELAQLAWGAARAGAELADGLGVDAARVTGHLESSHSLVVSERLVAVLTPVIGAERFAALLQQPDFAAAVRALPEVANLDVDALLDPAHYTGLAAHWVDRLHESPPS